MLNDECCTVRVFYIHSCCSLVRLAPHRKVFFCLTGPYLTRRATIGRLNGRLELPLGRGRFVDPPQASTKLVSRNTRDTSSITAKSPRRPGGSSHTSRFDSLSELKIVKKGAHTFSHQRIFARDSPDCSSAEIALSRRGAPCTPCRPPRPSAKDLMNAPPAVQVLCLLLRPRSLSKMLPARPTSTR